MPRDEIARPGFRRLGRPIPRGLGFRNRGSSLARCLARSGPILDTMTIREFDERLYRQLEMCLNGDYIATGSDAVTPAMLSGLRRSIDVAIAGRSCDCGEPGCRSFQIAGRHTTRSSRRIRFRVHGELAVVCDGFGGLQHIEWLPEASGARRRRYERGGENVVEVSLCPFPD
jgi:hypothetical protein